MSPPIQTWTRLCMCGGGRGAASRGSCHPSRLVAEAVGVGIPAVVRRRGRPPTSTLGRSGLAARVLRGRRRARCGAAARRRSGGRSAGPAERELRERAARNLPARRPEQRPDRCLELRGDREAAVRAPVPIRQRGIAIAGNRLDRLLEPAQVQAVPRRKTGPRVRAVAAAAVGQLIAATCHQANRSHQLSGRASSAGGPKMRASGACCGTFWLSWAGVTPVERPPRVTAARGTSAHAVR